MSASTYLETGFTEPVQICGPARTAQLRACIEKTVLVDGRGLAMRHLDSAAVFELCSTTSLLDGIAELLGVNVLLWRSRLFVKAPDSKATPWHSDGPYFTEQLDPVVNLTAWIALDDVGLRNACLRVIPGSHRQTNEHVAVPIPIDSVFYHEAAKACVDETRARDLEMRSGQCVIFNEALLHASTPNSTDRPRMALSVRFTIPAVRVKGSPDIGTVLVRGKDAEGLNTLLAPPSGMICLI